MTAFTPASSLPLTPAEGRRPEVPWPSWRGFLPPAAVARTCRGAMEIAFLPTGGLVSGDGLSLLMRRSVDQPISMLARAIVEREVLSLDIDGEIWLPMFQFEPSTLAVRPGVVGIMRELRDVFDDGEIAEWFATSNDWLHGRTPASVVLRDERSALEAARADRYVAVG